MRVLSIQQVVLGTMMALGFTGLGYGQAGAPGDVNNLAHQMAEQVRHLGEDIASDLGQAPQGRHLMQDTQELAQAVDQFHESLHGRLDPNSVRQAYGGIDGTWHHLRGQLSQPGSTSPAVDRAARRVDALDARIHQSLGMNEPPPGFYGGAQPPAGIAETRRLAHALVTRADALAAAIQGTMGNDPNGAALAEDATRLARAADGFHDAIDANQSVQVAAQAFRPVDELADRLERYVTTNRVPPPVGSAWQSFASVEVLIHQNLGLQSPQPNVQIGLAPPPGGGRSPLLDLAAQLDGETDAFVDDFAPVARSIPDGDEMLEDARRLQRATDEFRKETARGLEPNRLAHSFRDVDACWQRLARRVNRVARGRTGPNIARVQRLGEICEQVHRVLGMPGYAPVLGGPAFNPRPGPRDRFDER